MKCPKCEREIPVYTEKCAACGTFVQREECETTLCEGLKSTASGVWYWKCDESVFRCGFLFKSLNITFATIYILLFLITSFGIYRSDPWSEKAVPLLIEAIIVLAFYCFAVLYFCIGNSARFRGIFSLEENLIRVSEDTLASSNGFLRTVYIIFAVLFILPILIFGSLKNVHAANALMKDTTTKYIIKYEKICRVISNKSKTRIKLKKKIGSVTLIVTPEQCDLIENEIAARCRRINGKKV